MDASPNLPRTVSASGAYWRLESDTYEAGEDVIRVDHEVGFADDQHIHGRRCGIVQACAEAPLRWAANDTWVVLDGPCRLGVERVPRGARSGRPTSLEERLPMHWSA